MKNLILKCWDGIHGDHSFEVIGWEYDFNNIKEAQKYYSEIWPHCWVENNNGDIIKI